MNEFYETTYDMAAKKNADMEAVLFGQEDCLSSYAYGPTLRPYHLFHFVTKGEGEFRVGNDVYTVREGDLFLIPAEQVAYYDASPRNPWHVSWVGFTGVRAEQYVSQLMAVAPETYVLRGLNTEKYAALIAEAAVLHETNTVNYFLCQRVLYTVFSFLTADLPSMKKSGYLPSLADRVKFFLDAKYMDKLQISEVASYFHIHPNHLSRIFQQEFQVSPKQYLLELKLKRAALMLSTTDMPVRLIAESLGFEDQHAFSRMFKRKYGISPTACRRNSGV